jgi:DNA invertase Pin-like site-specific DNA recombinase
MHERGRNGHGGPAGSRNASAKLNESDIPKIRSLLQSGRKRIDIAKEFGISRSVIHRIQTGRAWSHVTD